jgi:hypothetical protein
MRPTVPAWLRLAALSFVLLGAAAPTEALVSLAG